MTPRRVVHVLNSTEVGGAETMALRLSTLLQDAGWAPEVVALRGEGGLSDAFLAAGIPVSSLGVPPGQGALAMGRALRHWLASRPTPAVVHTHNVSPLVATALALPRRRGMPRFVHTKHGRARPTSWRGRLVTRWAARRPDAIAVVSRDAAELATNREHYPARRLEVLYNGIAADAIVTRSGGWNHRIVTVARLEPIKTLDLLLHALVRVRSDGLAATLTIVGDGTERAHLEELSNALGLGEHVAFVGWQTDIEDRLRAADLFVLPSRSEGLSLTLLEAMAVGLPVVATAVGGNPEVIEEGVTGFLVPHGDPTALARAITTTLTTPDLARRYGEAGRARVLARFSLQSMAAGYLRLYGDE
ncbi:MAG: glycosyltransferase [Gemmatimonadales bacterium]|nr:glycosyltransferase [Gemmatimonadales bacterium]